MFARIVPPQQVQDRADAPFRVLHLQADVLPSGSFRPDARLVLAPALRTGGLWASLDPADAHILILLLSFLSPNGHVVPAVSQVAEALHCSPAQARTRLLRLTQREWQGQSLAVQISREDGNDAFAPGPSLLAQEHIPIAHEKNVEPLLNRAGREALLAHSRSRYAKPRAEVEAGIAARMGWGPPAFEEDPPDVAGRKQDLFQKMTLVGVTREQALDMLTRFPVDDVERQIDWLPHRNAKSPARFLLAAIENDYAPPLALKNQGEAAPHASIFALPPDPTGFTSDLPGITEDVFVDDARTAAEDGGHVPIHDPAASVEVPDEPGLPDGTLYRLE